MNECEWGERVYEWARLDGGPLYFSLNRLFIIINSVIEIIETARHLFLAFRNEQFQK